jgi:hypothetical protein
VPDLLPLLDDLNPLVRALGAGALGEVGDPEAAPPLAKLLNDGNGYVRARSVEALVRLDAKGHAEAIASLLKDPAKVEEAAEEARESVDGSEADALMDALRMEYRFREEVTVGAVAGLGLCALGSRRGMEAFLALRDRDRFSFNPIPLNALRQPAAWERLRGKVLGKDLRGRARDLLETVAAEGQVRLDLDPKDLDRAVVSGSTAGPKWTWSRGTPVLEALGRMLEERGCSMVVEADRVRVVPLFQAVEFWEAWVRKELGK